MFFGRDAAASHDLVHFLSARVQVLAASSGAEVCGGVLCGAADVLVGSLERVLVAAADWVAGHDKLLQLFVVGGPGHILAKQNRHSESDRSILIVNITGNAFFKNFLNLFLQKNSTRMSLRSNWRHVGITERCFWSSNQVHKLRPGKR